MKTPMLILCLAGASLSIAVRWTIEAAVTIEDRVMTLERTMEACCATTHGLYPSEEAAHKAYVELKKRVHELEKRVKELER